jgi:hypothetical protein
MFWSTILSFYFANVLWAMSGLYLSESIITLVTYCVSASLDATFLAYLEQSRVPSELTKKFFI